MNDTATPGFSLERELDRHWRRWVAVAWLVIAAYWLYQRWGGITWLALSDTDDNMRLMQVRALLAGQDWYDLRQYRMNPPEGFDIHWSRLVDLPIAGLILLLKPLIGVAWAERIAVGVAPLLPFGAALAAIAVTARRLIAPVAWPLAIIFLFGCTATLLMFMPLRIDHHGWQLACLAWTVAGLADRDGARGGMTVGVSSAVSLTIGLELLPYCAMAGAIVTLRWVWARDEAARLSRYALALGTGSATGFLLFASHANRALVCDALTPVWLSVMVAAGVLLALLARTSPTTRTTRLALAAVAGAIIVAGFATLFPQCLGRPENVSPELYRLWLGNVREAKPIFAHPLRVTIPLAAVPVIGLIGAVVSAWRTTDPTRRTGWVAIALFTAFAVAMLAWQVRAGPAAQLLGLIGATSLAWRILPRLIEHPSIIVRVGGSVAAFMLLSGLFTGLVIRELRIDPPSRRAQVVSAANRRCAGLASLRLLDRQPAGLMFTHVDLGPRLITTTHHDAVAGPYHRNGDAILDVHHAFSGSAAQAQQIIARHHASYLLTCPNMAETTVYRVRAPDGFYSQLVAGRVPAWLRPVKLPAGAPYRLWRIDHSGMAEADVPRRSELNGGTNL